MNILTKPTTRTTATLPPSEEGLETKETLESSPAQSRSARFIQLCLDVVVPFILTRLLLVLIGILTISYILPLFNRHQPILPMGGARYSRFPDMLFLMWDHFDSGFYLNIAEHGYWGANTLHSMSNWAFFPLYPLLIRILAFPFGNSDGTFHIVALFVSNSAALIATLYLYKLTTKELGRTAAARAVLYLLLFPMSFYLSAIYPESLFLALAISCFYYARLQRWWLAGILGGLASLTRPQGVLLALVVGFAYVQFLAGPFEFENTAGKKIELVQEWLRSRITNLLQSLKKWRTWLGFTSLLLIPSGLLLFSLYAKWQVGSFRAFSLAEKYGWGRELTNPLPVLKHYIQHPEAMNPYNWNFYSLNMTIIVIFFLLLIPIIRKFPLVYAIFTFVSLIMPLTSGEVNSIARYYISVFPVFMILAWWSSRGTSEQQVRRSTLLSSSFALLLALGMVFFTLAIYSIA